MSYQLTGTDHPPRGSSSHTSTILTPIDHPPFHSPCSVITIDHQPSHSPCSVITPIDHQPSHSPRPVITPTDHPPFHSPCSVVKGTYTLWITFYFPALIHIYTGTHHFYLTTSARLQNIPNGGSKGGAPGTRAPTSWPKFLHFHAVFGKN